MNRIAVYLFLITMAAGLSNCKKFLADEPYNRLSVSDIFRDFEGARTAMLGCYTDLNTAEYYNRDFAIYADLTGGNAKLTRTNIGRFLFTSTFTNDARNSELTSFYTTAYSIIFNANNVLQFARLATDIRPEQLARLRADAFTMRALCHFDLVRVFAQPPGFTPNAQHPGIVLNLTNPSFVDGPQPQSTVADVYASIVRDLDSAMALYPSSVDIYTFGNARSFFSLAAAQALKSRVSLYRADWAAVIANASSIIGNAQYTLVTNNAYANAWRGKTIHPESIFEIAFGNRMATALGNYYNFASNTGYLAASNDLLSLFGPNDIRGGNNMFVQNGGQSYTRKYLGINDSANNIKVIRLSEMYLNRAEAHARLGNLTAALADLNAIRRRANPLATDFTTTDTNVFLEELFAERRRELCFETQLFFDIARLGRNLQRTDCAGANCSFSFPNALFASPIPVNQ